MEFSTSLIKFNSSFLSQRTLRVSVEDEMPTPREMQAGVLQGFILSPTLYSMYINDVPKQLLFFLSLFADDTCLYATDRKGGFLFRELQRGLSSMEKWCERCNMKINEYETRAIYVSHRLRPLRLILH
jgi:hypothetical protein